MSCKNELSVLHRFLFSVVSSPTRGSSFFLGKVTALGVLCCFALFVCLTLLASFFLPSHLSFKNMYTKLIYIVHLQVHVHCVSIMYRQRIEQEQLNRVMEACDMVMCMYTYTCTCTCTCMYT